MATRRLQSKTPEQLAAQVEFLNSTNESQLKEQDSLFAVENMKKLSKEQIIERLFLVTNQAQLVKWRLFWELRKRFPKYHEFKKQLNDLRGDESYGHCIEKQQQINRALHAGRFCEEHRIVDLNKTGVYPTAIYLLSKPVNKPIADEIFKAIKGRNIPVTAVTKMIDEANLRLGYKEPSELDIEDDIEREHIPPYIIPVVNNVAIIEGEVNREEEAIIDLVITHDEEEQSETALVAKPIMTTFTELSPDKKSDEDMARDILEFCIPYERNFMKLNAVLKIAMDINTKQGYNK